MADIFAKALGSIASYVLTKSGAACIDLEHDADNETRHGKVRHLIFRR
jgi:hypothetical protein